MEMSRIEAEGSQTALPNETLSATIPLLGKGGVKGGLVHNR